MEKRVLYGLVVMLIYLVGSGFGQGEVRLMIEEAKWTQFLTKTQLPTVLTITSSLCGFPCVVVEDQVARLAQTYGEKVIFNTANILLNPFLVQLYEVVSIPTIIVFKDGKEIFRYEKLSDWEKIYDLVFDSWILDSAMPPSDSASPSPSPFG
ncbi:unnamed protein product [Microthlaspi erraticum]|uniref:Thioredoxin domain-containing protein n=1 Tax=Microthlaspi erraticum TaxID=1685480 RepID=A0A6D2HKF1_9BRAS|nr:unnamed protein product [Microthlaspi erraticum]